MQAGQERVEVEMAHTPQQGSRVRPHLPEVSKEPWDARRGGTWVAGGRSESGAGFPPSLQASPFSSVLARLPDLSPPRTKYTTSFGSLNPLASPAPASTFGFRAQRWVSARSPSTWASHFSAIQ